MIRYALIAMAMSPSHVETTTTVLTRDLPQECNDAYLDAEFRSGDHPRVEYACVAIDEQGRRVETTVQDIVVFTAPALRPPADIVIETRER